MAAAALAALLAGAAGAGGLGGFSDLSPLSPFLAGAPGRRFARARETSSFSRILMTKELGMDLERQREEKERDREENRIGGDEWGRE